MHALKTLVAVTAASLTISACASSGNTTTFARQLSGAPVANGTQLVQASNQATSARGSSAGMPATVRVANYNWMDVNVYAVQGGTRMRLGTVTTMGNGTFQLPARFVQGGSAVRLMVDPIGSAEGYMTDGFLVNAGQQVSFNVQNSLQFSSISVSSR
jgi:hypothetical protein